MTARSYRLMGIVNVTPDSFSDGGRVPRRRRGGRARRAAGRARARTILDVGGESTRPGRGAGARARRSCARVLPVIEGLAPARRRRRRSRSTPPRRAVARAALDAGRELVNDVTRAARRPGDGRAGRRARRRLLPDAHAGRAAHDAGGRAALRRRRRRGQGVPRGAPASSPSRRASRASGSCSTRASASARRSSTTSSCSRRLDELVGARPAARSSAPRASASWADPR